jgi:predicted MFS family arabinose efflux permease
VIVGSLAGAVVLLAAFALVELRSTRPMFDLTLFRKPAFVGVSAVAFALSAGMFAMFLYVTIYMQGILGLDALEAGVRFLPLTLLSFFVAPIAGRLLTRVPARVFFGLGLGLVGTGLLLMRGVDADSEWTTLLPGFLVAGAGIGMTNPAIASTAVGVVTAAKAGMGSGINNTCRQVGIATGIAGLGAIFQHQIASHLPSSAPDGAAEAIASSGTRAAEGQGDQVVAAAEAAFIHGFNEILLIAGLITFAGAALGLLLTREEDMVAHGPAEEAVPGAE